MENKPIYKTAKELKITRWEREGLIALIGPLSRGDLAVDMTLPEQEIFKPFLLVFKRPCGTVRCIGGSLAAAHGIDAEHYVNRARVGHPTLRALFFPTDGVRRDPHPAWHCSSQQAASAIINFLMFGEPRWDDVMATES